MREGGRRDGESEREEGREEGEGRYLILNAP